MALIQTMKHILPNLLRSGSNSFNPSYIRY